MLRQEPSRTAQAVAAVRNGAERVPVGYGDPDADDRLQRQVAVTARAPSAPMRRYLLARTRFFDVQLVRALEAGIAQVVIAAAGYDGRSLRYAKPGVRFIELDHPVTQADKLARLAEIDADTAHVRFAAADFNRDDITACLLSAGCDPGQRSIVLAEGIAVYLPESTLASLLHALHAAVVPTSLLAISLSIGQGTGRQAAQRAAFRRRAAAVGEPALTDLSADRADQLLARTGWQTSPVPITTGHHARCLGLVTGIATTTRSEEGGPPGDRQTA